MEFIVDMSNAVERMNLINSFHGLIGPHRVEIVKYRKRRSDKQNRAYWPCIVIPFWQALRERGNDIDEDTAHEILKATFLKRYIHDSATGEILREWVESTTKLDTKQFAEYVEQCSQLLAEEFGIIVSIGYEPTTTETRD